MKTLEEIIAENKRVNKEGLAWSLVFLIVLLAYIGFGIYKHNQKRDLFKNREPAFSHEFLIAYQTGGTSKQHFPNSPFLKSIRINL